MIEGICDGRHGAARRQRAESQPMECLLQVVDEFDDWLGAIKHHWFGLRMELGMMRKLTAVS